MRFSDDLKGRLLCIAGTLFLTPDTLLLRSVSSVPNYTVLFIKFAFYVWAFVAYFAWRWKSRALEKFRDLRLFGVIAGIVWGISNACFVLAIQHVYVANVLVICSGNSIFSAFISRVFIGEKIPVRTLVTCVVCFGAILLVFAAQLGSASSGESTFGNILALIASITMGMYFAMVRYVELKTPANKEPVDMVACNIMAGVGVCVFSLAFGGVPSIDISPVDSFLLFLQGGVLMPLSFGLLTVGPSFISAPEVSLYMLLETILGPVLVFFAGYEKPPMMSIYGGIIIVVALAVNSILAFREEKSVHPIHQINSKSNLLEMTVDVEQRIETKFDKKFDNKFENDSAISTPVYEYSDENLDNNEELGLPFDV